VPKKSRARSTQKFSGELASPIVGNRDAMGRSGLLDARSDEEIVASAADEQRRVIAEWTRKLGLLRDHYGIAQERHWELPLVLALANDFVPGFRVQFGEVPKRGRKRKWTSSRYMSLLGDVALLQIEDPTRGDLDALTLLIKQQRFAERWGGEKPSSLEKRLHEARTSDASFMARIIRVDRNDPESYRNLMQSLATRASVNANTVGSDK
jgi:hypothetical protein